MTERKRGLQPLPHAGRMSMVFLDTELLNSMYPLKHYGKKPAVIVSALNLGLGCAFATYFTWLTVVLGVLGRPALSALASQYPTHHGWLLKPAMLAAAPYDRILFLTLATRH